MARENILIRFFLIVKKILENLSLNLNFNLYLKSIFRDTIEENDILDMQKIEKETRDKPHTYPISLPRDSFPNLTQGGEA